MMATDDVGDTIGHTPLIGLVPPTAEPLAYRLVADQLMPVPGTFLLVACEKLLIHPQTVFSHAVAKIVTLHFKSRRCFANVMNHRKERYEPHRHPFASQIGNKFFFHSVREEVIPDATRHSSTILQMLPQ